MRGLIASMPLAGLASLDDELKGYSSIVPFGLVFTFDGDTVAAGGSTSQEKNIPSDADFLITEVCLSARLASSSSSSVAGTPLAYEGLPNSDNNELPTMELVRFNLRDNDLDWFSAAVPATHAAGNTANPRQLKVAQILDARGDLSATVYNDSAVSLKFYLTLIGAKLYGGGSR